MNIRSLLKEHIDDSEGVGAALDFIDDGKIQFFSCGKKNQQKGMNSFQKTLFLR